MNELLQLMHDTMGKTAAIKGVVNLLQMGTLTKEDETKLIGIIGKSADDLIKVIDTYYIKEKEKSSLNKIMVGEPKIANFWGKQIHLSVGAIIKNDKGEILMIDRLKQPFGWACPAGHIDEGEEPLEALLREVKEETGLDMVSCVEHRINYSSDDYSDAPQETCSRGIDFHMWFIYDVVASGELIFKADEVKAIKWCSVEEIKTLPLEQVWKYWLEKLNII